MKINSKIKVKYIGESDPLMLIHNKIYNARILAPDKQGHNWFGVIDEAKDEYAYPPELFEIVDENGK